MVLLVAGVVLALALVVVAGVRSRRRGRGRGVRHEPLPPTGRRRPGPLHPSASEIAVSRQEHGRRLPGSRW